MQAIIYERYGSPDVLCAADRDKPAPRNSEILVRVKAAEVTKADCELRAFQFPVKWFALPLRLVMGVRRPRREILGGYFAGVVEAIGSAVTKHQVGDEVYGGAQLRMGAYAEYATFPETYAITRKPENMSFEEAAAVPLGGLNALHFMRKAQVGQGDRVLINGAGGSIGSFALQIAKAWGAHVTVVDAPHKRELLEHLGADDFIDYTAEDLSQRELDFDVVFDIVASSSTAKCLSVLKAEGRYVNANPTLSTMIRCAFSSLFSRRSASFAFAGESLEELQTLRDMIQTGQLRAPIDRVFSRSEIQAAHRRVESEQRIGVVVLSHEKQ